MLSASYSRVSIEKNNNSTENKIQLVVFLGFQIPQIQMILGRTGRLKKTVGLTLVALFLTSLLS